MPSSKRSSLSLAAIVDCGFMVDPVLTGLSVGPQSPNMQQGTTLQMSAIWTYDVGPTKTLTSNAFWSSNPSAAAITASSGARERNLHRHGFR